MADLTKNQESFIELMKKSEEHAFRGFELLGKRHDLDNFFDALNGAGFFAPERNPAPVPVEPTGSVRIPFWPALGYLIACATISDQRNDLALAQKVMDVVRASSAFTEADGSIRDNYHTYRKFAEILGIVPPTIVLDTDVQLVSVWLSSRFDTDTVAHALDIGPIKRFLASDDRENWSKAGQMVRHCLAFRWKPQSGRGVDDGEPVTVIDPYWLKELIDHHAVDLGKKIGAEAAVLFRDAVAEIFNKGGRATWSYLFRPAVEDNSQNHSWKSAENALVEGLRDVLLSWSEADAVAARAFVQALLGSDIEMLRRIAIYIVNERWSLFRDLYMEHLSPDLFHSGHIHELYGLLANRFEGLAPEHKAATLDAIRSLPLPDGDDPNFHLKRTQRRWLEAIASAGYEPAAKWIKELAADPHVGVPDHPDFNSYIETGWGPGRSPYEVQELVTFAEQRSAVKLLNDFKADDSWRGPSSEALVETLERAVMNAPSVFLSVLADFVDAGPRYQTAVVNGFRRLWEAGKDQLQPQSSVDWTRAWPILFDFFQSLFHNPDAGRRMGADFTQSWLLSAVSDTLQSGTRSDEHAYPAELLPRGWALLETLLDRADATQKSDDTDPMSAAINSPKGRTIEAAFSHVLRACRLADKKSGSHAAAWADMRGLFDRELQKTHDSNYEFSTLLGAYFANLDYVDGEWLVANLAAIFPVQQPQFLCAIGGLAYASATIRIYDMLRDAGVIEAALRSDVKGRETRKKLIERVVLGYLWGRDDLNSSRFSSLFEMEHTDDLEHAAWFMWTARDGALSEPQVARVADFLDRCVTWSRVQSNPPAKLLSTLSELTWALSDAAGRNRELLLAIASYVPLHHRTHEFLRELARLLDISPAETTEVLGKLIESFGPTPVYYDYEGRLRALIKRIAELGDRTTALAYCDRLRSVDGMLELFSQLRTRG